MLAEYPMRFIHVLSSKVHAAKHIEEGKYRTSCGFWVHPEKHYELFRPYKADAKVTCKRCFLIIREKGDEYE